MIKENNLILTDRDFNLLIDELSTNKNIKLKDSLYYILNNICDIKNKMQDFDINLNTLSLNQNNIKTSLYIDESEIELIIAKDDTNAFQIIYDLNSNYVIMHEYHTEKRNNKLCIFYLDNNNESNECYLTVKYKDLERLLNSYLQIISVYEQKLKDQMSEYLLNKKEKLNTISNIILDTTLASMSMNIDALIDSGNNNINYN